MLIKYKFIIFHSQKLQKSFIKHQDQTICSMHLISQKNVIQFKLAYKKYYKITMGLIMSSQLKKGTETVKEEEDSSVLQRVEQFLSIIELFF